MDQFLGGRSMIEDARIGLFENHHTTTLDAWVCGIHSGRNEIGAGDICNEASSLIDIEQGLFAALPFRNAYFPAQHARINTDVGNGFSQDEGTAPRLSIITWLWWSGQAHIVLRLLRDRKSTRLNSSHLGISYAVFC